MKKILIALLFLIACTPARYMEPEIIPMTGSVHWSKFHYSTIKNNETPIMIYVCNDKREVCHKMDKTFVNNEVSSYLNEHFIAIELEASESAMDLFISSKDIPAMLFMGPTNNGPGFTIEVEGPIAPDVMLSILKKINARSHEKRP